MAIQGEGTFLSPLFFLTLRRRSTLPEQSKVPLGQAPFLRANSPDYSAVDVCQRLFSALMKVGQRLVLDAHKVEDGGVDVVDVRFFHHGLEAEFVGLPVAPAAGHPHAEAVRVVVAAGRALAFAERHAAKFAASHDERGVQQSALLEVG